MCCIVWCAKTCAAWCFGGAALQVDQVVTQILSEADLDGDEKLSYVEFEHIVSRAPDFSNTFRIRI